VAAPDVVALVAGRPEARRAGRWLFLLTLGVYAFTAGGSLTSSDAVVTVDVTRNIVERRTVAMSGNLLGMDAHRGADGRYYAPFGIGQSIYNVPFYLAGKAFVAATGFRAGKADSLPKAFVALAQTLLAATIVWQTYRLCLTVTGGVIPSAMAALTLAFGSILWPYARFGFNQPLACATMLGAVSETLAGVRTNDNRRLVMAGVWLALSLLTRHELILAAAPIGGWLLVAGDGPTWPRLRRLIAFAPGVAAGLTVWLVFNAIRFGNPLDSGFLRDPVPGFGSPVWSGVIALLFSPSASLFLYSPVAIFGLVGLARAIFTRDRAPAMLLLAVSATFIACYATLGNWLGGRSYGSRYLVVIVPYLAVGWAALLSATSATRRRLLFALVTAVGVALQVPGVLVDYAKVSQAQAGIAGGFSTAARQWEWRASGLVMNTRAIARAIPDNIRYVTGRAPVPEIVTPAGPDDRGFSQQFAFSLDFWWLYLFYLHALSRAALAAVIVGFAAWIALCAHRLIRAMA
jgi:hypothetical protein